jgi:hypothetical protein
MAQPTNTYDSYDQVGIREDLTDKIWNVTPYDTPFMSSASKTTASNTFHEWQTDVLRSSAANAAIEGDEATGVARTPTVRLGNYTQILRDTIVVTDTDEGLNKAGRSKEMAYQIAKAVKTLKLDGEKACLDNNARVAGNATTARELAGVPAWLTTNVEFENGNSGANPTGDGSDARTDDGTPVAFSQTRFNTTMQSLWRNSGGGASKKYTVLLNDFQMDAALGFTGNNNQRSTVPAEQGKTYNVTDFYMTPWGTVEFVMSRECRARDVFVLDMDYWKIAQLRPMQDKPLAKTGDSEKRLLTWEWTLESCNEAASGAVYDNTTS